MHGVSAKRRVQHYGWVYGYETWRLNPGPPIPEFLIPAREHAARLAGLKSEDFEEVLVTEYPAHSGIGWHRDAPMFGPSVVGVSLLSSCRLRFRRQAGARILELSLEPRSAYILGGEARTKWQHSIPPTVSLRYSITFRTVRRQSLDSRTRIAANCQSKKLPLCQDGMCSRQ